jgi:hypothetical protein
MEMTALILVVVDSSLTGVLCGVLIFRWLERSINKSRDQAVKPVTNVLVLHPEGRGKDPPEVLVKKVENTISVGNVQPLEPHIFQKTEIAAGNKTPFLVDPNINSDLNIPGKPEIINDKIITIKEKHKKSRQSSFIKELDTNLKIATAPWKDRPVPFQTTCWDAKLEKVEPGMVSHLQDLIQLYVDISLANNVVWLATEIGHRSKELDESYIKLCSGIAERIRGIVPAITEAI